MGNSTLKTILSLAALATVVGAAHANPAPEQEAEPNIVITRGAFGQDGEFVVNDGVNLRNVAIEQRGDSVLVEFDVVVDGRNVKSKESMTIIPVVNGRGEVSLPTVLINGTRRSHVYTRAQALAGRNRDAEPGLLMTARNGRTTTGHYSHTFRVTPELEGALLSLESFSATCCTESPHSERRITEEPLMAWVDTPQQTEQPVQQPPEVIPPASQRPTVDDVIEEVVRHEEQPHFEPALRLPTQQSPAGRVEWLEPDEEQVKRRETSVTARINYPQGGTQVLSGYGDNYSELARIEEIISPLFGDRGIYNIRRVRIDGYASIEGQWDTNDELARRRAETFGRYLYDRFGMRGGEVATYSHGEDWEGLKRMVAQDRAMPMGRIVEEIISYVDVFQGRERELMALDEGVPYRYMYRYFFPLLRRMEITFEYDVRAFEGGEAEQVMRTRPGDLSHAEMLRVLRRWGVDEREIYRTLARNFPDDAVALINAATAELMAGDSAGAWEYLRKVEGDPRAEATMSAYRSLTATGNDFAETGVEP